MADVTAAGDRCGLERRLQRINREAKQADRDHSANKEENPMNRRLGNFVRASLFALPFALPTVAFAQSAGGSSSGTIGATDNTSARQSRTTTTQTDTFDEGKPDARSGNLGIDREGNSTRDNDPVQSSDTTGDVDQHMTKQQTTQKHDRALNDDGTTTTRDSTSSTTTSDKDHDAP
jgi:hypothetical protein